MSALVEWPLDQVEAAIEALAPPHAKLHTESGLPIVEQAADIQAWVYAAATRRALDAVPLRLEGDAAGQLIAQGAPCLLRTQGGVIAVRAVGGREAVLAAPTGRDTRVPLEQIIALLYAGWRSAYHLPDISDLLDETSLPANRKANARLLFSRHQLATSTINAGWSVRVASSAPFARQLRYGGLGWNQARLILAVVGVQLSTILAWYLIGQAALEGQVDFGRVAAWALAVVTAVVLEVLAIHWQGLVSIGFTTLLKRRLMLGVLRIDAKQLRHEGLGLSMGRVMACENVEALALTGGLTSLLAGVELIIALSALALASWALFSGFLLLTAAMVVLGIFQLKATRSWVATRLSLTHDLIERMLGHRTRVLQEAPERWHTEEDALLAAYEVESRRFDRLIAAVRALVPRSSLVLGLTFIVPLFVTQASMGAVSVALGAVLLTQRALLRLSVGLASLTSSGVAWQRAAPVFLAARQNDDAPTIEGVRAIGAVVAPQQLLVHARDVDFSFEAGRPPVLEGVTLKLRVGDHALLEGASGSGKSTLAGLLSGARQPTSGLLLIGGLDRTTLGRSGWRRKVVAAPQSHENHLLQGSLAFNLLFGRAWPPQKADLDASEALCTELGLRPLLERMPEGILQPVGSAGWRLSHGERSRVFIARALLQRSELVVLDESFAALDPETLAKTMACVRARARTLVVVAHP